MAQIIWSRPALLDLSRLHAFLQQKNPDAARRAIAAIRQSTKLLMSHPTAGRPADAITGDVRDLPVSFGAGGYLIRYRTDGDRVLVLAVRHMREAGY